MPTLYYPGLKLTADDLASIPEDVTHAELTGALKALAETGEANPEKIIEAINEIRKAGGKDALEAMESPLSPEKVEAELSRYKEMYGRWGAGLKKKCPWKEIERRLLTDMARNLKHTMNMREGSVLFDLDRESNPLFADGGYNLPYQGADYSDARNTIIYENPRYQRGSTSFRLFKPGEVIKFEKFTGKPFVTGDLASWIESDEWDNFPLEARHDKKSGEVSVSHCGCTHYDNTRGARRIFVLEEPYEAKSAMQFGVPYDVKTGKPVEYRPPHGIGIPALDARWEHEHQRNFGGWPGRVID
jgi:hypothetical protein